ncbi:helix-turn-helix domain-containing protein [Serratia marcescens]|uniref:helix-turn-helix domain-containing protein n=1 Tax=Serratia marcescens TaxID=615 RepID=UPI003ED919A8
MSTLGERLREERDRLGLNQTDFAKLADHSRSAQAAYERNEKIPGGSYLSALAVIGIDVMYILTGNKTPKTVIDEVSMEERKLIENYRAMDEAARLNMQAVSDSFAHSKPNKKVGEQ